MKGDEQVQKIAIRSLQDYVKDLRVQLTTSSMSNTLEEGLNPISYYNNNQVVLLFPCNSNFLFLMLM